MGRIYRKECLYKGCNNTSFNSKNTFFRFPRRDESKFNDWVKRSKCDVKSMTNSSRNFICEDHFDAIYKTTNPRRKALLSAAVPIIAEPGSEEPEEEPTYENADSEPDIDLDESPTKRAKTSSRFILVDDNEEEQDESYEILHVFETDSNNEEELITDKLEELKPTSTIKTPKRDQSLITTFIFKGEEYIQMPKEMFDEQETSSKCSELKVKLLEDAFIDENKQMDKILTSLKELTEKFNLVVEENKIYKSALGKAKEALALIPE